MGPSRAPLWIQGLRFRESKGGAGGHLGLGMPQPCLPLPLFPPRASTFCPATFCNLLGLASLASACGSPFKHSIHPFTQA